MLVIVDYGLGNLASIQNMLKKAKELSVITSDPSIIQKATKIILPGVGSFDTGMKNLRARNLENVLTEKVLHEKVPTLGICLGMQMFTNRSEEGTEKGLGWIDAEAIRFQLPEGKLKIPHMGWADLQLKKESFIFRGMEDEKRFYFVHSFHVRCNDPADVLATTHYGYDFDSAIAHENIVGVQFHPEKSHRFGLGVLKNFAQLESNA